MFILSDSEIEEQVLPSMSPRSSPSNLGASPFHHRNEPLSMPDLISPIPQTSLLESASLEHANADAEVLPEPGPSSAPDLCTANVQEEDAQLDEDILQILGEPPQSDIALGKNIHKDIATRWQDILIKGLPREQKEPLLKKYLIPANCHFLVAPLLNPEAKAATPDILARRDTTLLQKQNQIGAALAALSQVTEMILRNETSKQALLLPLSDACRILCDSHCIEGRTRRSIIMSSINTNLRDVLANTNRDKYLFGEDLTEKLRAAKFVQKTGESLQKTNPIASTSKSSSNFRGTPRNRNLNFRGPIQRKPPNKTSESSRGRQPARQTRGFNHSRQPPPLPKTSSPTRRNYRR